MPKVKVKMQAAHLYGGETATSDTDYNEYQRQDLHLEAKFSKELILGIESSFNDSGAAVVKGNGEILSNQILTFSEKYHSEHAPILSKEHHQRSLPIVVEKALHESGKNIRDMKAIAVTIGPGQLPSLQMGIDFA